MTNDVESLLSGTEKLLGMIVLKKPELQLSRSQRNRLRRKRKRIERMLQEMRDIMPSRMELVQAGYSELMQSHFKYVGVN